MDNLEKVFNEIVETYSERLYWHVRRFTCSHEDTDDLLQDIFIKIWKALPSFRGEAQLYTWVFRIATNETLNFLRKEKVRSLLMEPLKLWKIGSCDGERRDRVDRIGNLIPERNSVWFALTRFFPEARLRVS